MHSFTDEQLIDLAEGRLAPANAAVLRAKIAADPLALAELRTIEALITLMRTDTSEDAPEPVVNRAIRLMRQPETPPEPTLLQRIIATLSSDSWRTPLAAGMRTGQTGPRGLVYHADDCVLDLQIVPSGELWQLHGQVLGPDEAGNVTLSGAQRTVTASLNQLGEFSLPPVAADRYTLVLRQGAREVVITDLELGPLSHQT